MCTAIALGKNLAGRKLHGQVQSGAKPEARSAKRKANNAIIGVATDFLQQNGSGNTPAAAEDEPLDASSSYSNLHHYSIAAQIGTYA